MSQDTLENSGDVTSYLKLALKGMSNLPGYEQLSKILLFFLRIFASSDSIWLDKSDILQSKQKTKQKNAN